MQTNRKAIVAAIAGNAMEWYDFTVFALMTPVIKNLFFPVDPKDPGSEINALLLTAALFGSGFFMRPVGGVVLGYFALLYPLYAWVIAAPSIYKLLVCQVVIGFFSAFFLGVYCTTLVELFPIRVRSTALAIVNNVAVLIFGGFAQFFVTWLIALTGSPLAPIFYVMIGVGLGLISVIAMRPHMEGAGVTSLPSKRFSASLKRPSRAMRRL